MLPSQTKYRLKQELEVASRGLVALSSLQSKTYAPKSKYFAKPLQCKKNYLEIAAPTRKLYHRVGAKMFIKPSYNFIHSKL